MPTPNNPGFIVPEFFSPKTDTKINWDVVDRDSIDKLNLARYIAGVPFRITSHHRTPEHSVSVGGSATDAHTQTPCGAFDIAYSDTFEAFRIVRGLMFAGFKRIGINARNKHIHADTAENLPTPRFWVE